MARYITSHNAFAMWFDHIQKNSAFKSRYYSLKVNIFPKNSDAPRYREWQEKSKKKNAMRDPRYMLFKPTPCQLRPRTAQELPILMNEQHK